MQDFGRIPILVILVSSKDFLTCRKGMYNFFKGRSKKKMDKSYDIFSNFF